VKIELSSKELLSGTLSFLCLIFAYPINAGSQWLCQFMPEFLSNFYVDFLSISLLFNSKLMVFSCFFLCACNIGFCLSQLFYTMIKSYLRNKKSSPSTDSIILDVNKEKVDISPKKFLIIMSMGALVGFIGLFHFLSILKDTTYFERRTTILSSKLTPNEIGAYKAKWLMMKTAKDFRDLKTAMEQDAKKHHLKLN
jgi:uncharacterized sodium:solute symporter family permease YidK